MNMMHKRESGENPERCRHCVRELLQSPLGDREGESAMNEVRRTAFAWDCGSAGHRTSILITLYDHIVYCRYTSAKREKHLAKGTNVLMRSIAVAEM